MFRILLSIGIGVILGGAAVFTTIDREPAGRHPSALSLPALTGDDDPRRACPATIERPATPGSVKLALAQQTSFDKNRALMELAAEAGPARLQSLIFDAYRTGDPGDRRTALWVLLGRLAELDPRSALAIARLDEPGNRRALLDRVWQVWAGMDLEGALRESLRQPDAYEREFAAQAMFSAQGYMGNAVTRRIEAVTGISPGGESRKHYFQRLADESPAGAVSRVNEIDTPELQQEAIAILADHLLLKFGAEALGHGALLANPGQQLNYRARIINGLGARDPQSAISAVSRVDDEDQRYQLLDLIIRQVASTDTYHAKLLADQLVDVEARDFAYYRIVRYHARIDPLEAAGWATLITAAELRGYLEQSLGRSID